MRWLVHTASVQYTSLQERVRRDVAVEKEKQERKMAERRERVERMKTLRQQESKRAEEEQAGLEMRSRDAAADGGEVGTPQSMSRSSSPPMSTKEKAGSPEVVYAVGKPDAAVQVEELEEESFSPPPDELEAGADLPGVVA